MDTETIARIGLEEYLARLDAIEQLEAERACLKEERIRYERA